MVDFEVPFISESELCKQAEWFLRDHRASGLIPVPIERIIDVDLQINVIPIRGLKRVCDTDAFISSDFTEISVDEPVYKHPNQNRYRFSLAHEIAHYVLHRKLFTPYPVHSLEGYLAFRARISAYAYDRLELQANCMARFMLVPRALLSTEFNEAKNRARRAGFALERNWAVGIQYVSAWLGRRFQVSPAVVAIRLEHDHLVPGPM